MTLLVSAVTRNHVFHASDRLLTYALNNKIEEHDVRANKTIIVVGSDCWIVLGYTGVAYLDGKPTDQVIAESISGVSDLSGGGMVLLSQEKPLRVHFEEIGKRTVEGVEPAFRRLPLAAQEHGLILLGSGLQFTKKRWRHFYFMMTFNKSGWDSEGDPGRHITWNSFALHAAGAVDAEVNRQMHERAMRDGHESPEHMRSLMVDAVQATSAVSPTVGENVISVVLAPEFREINVHFRQSEKGPPIESPSLSPDRTLPPAALYTPYTLMPTAIFCPSASSVGGWRGDGISLKFHGTPSTIGGGFMSSYRREPPPRVRRLGHRG